MLTSVDLIKQVRPREAGADDGSNNFPSPDAKAYASSAEQDIRTLCQDEISKQFDALIERISKARAEITTARNSVPNDIVNVAGNIKVELNNILGQHKSDIAEAADEVERRGRDFRRFRVLNEVNYEPNYDPSLVNLGGTAFLVIAIESAANAYFFGQASATGLAGGFFTAAMVSLVNVVFGFLTGLWVLRQFNHIKRWRLILAIPSLALLLPGAFVFNLIVGQYREALQKNPDALILETVPNALAHLLDIKSFESMILILLGLIIFSLSVAKGYRVWDPYPGYMSKHKALRIAIEQRDYEQEWANKQVEERIGGELTAFAKIGPLLRSIRGQIDSSWQSIEGGITAINSQIAQIEQAGNDAIRLYRTANEEVRNAPAPAYFQMDFEIERVAKINELDAVGVEVQSALEHISKIEGIYQNSQLELTKLRTEVMGQLEGIIATSELEATTRMKKQMKQEKEERELILQEGQKDHEAQKVR